MNKDWVISKMYEEGLVGLEWAADYMAKAAEACRSSAQIPDGLEEGVSYAIRQYKKYTMHLGADTIREILFKSIDDSACLIDGVPESAQNIPMPKPPLQTDSALEASKLFDLLTHQHSKDLEELAGARSLANRKAGKKLAQAALSLKGWFHWMPAGPEEEGVHRFAPKEKGGEKDTTNAFAVWLNRGGPPPNKDSYMNCWEAVFFSAYTAGLVALEGLRFMHSKATQSARQVNSSLEYFDKLMLALGFAESVPMVEQIGLIQKAGDIVFVASDHHVAVCAGRSQGTGLAAVQVMSLWKHPEDGFLNISIKEFPPVLLKEVRFAPCPFA